VPRIGWSLRTATRAGRGIIAQIAQPNQLLDFRFLSPQSIPGVCWGKGNNMDVELHEHLMRVTVDTFKKETDKLKEENERLREKLLAESTARNKRADELTSIYATLELTAKELTYERKALTLAKDALLRADYTPMPNGEWRPPLGKRPDFEGADLIKAAIEMFRASAVVQQAVQRYEEAHK
jgi:hypothetical protein